MPKGRRLLYIFKKRLNIRPINVYGALLRKHTVKSFPSVKPIILGYQPHAEAGLFKNTHTHSHTPKVTKNLPILDQSYYASSRAFL